MIYYAFANPMLMNECDAPESNNTFAGWESVINIPAIIASFCKISASVKLTCPEQLTGTFFLMIVRLIRRKLVEG